MSYNHLSAVAVRSAVNAALAAGGSAIAGIPAERSAYSFRFRSSYQGTSSFDIRDESGTYRADLRHMLSAYERAGFNPGAPTAARDAETSIGILRRCVADNAGEIPAATVAAFNAWRAAKHADDIAALQAKYGADIVDGIQPPEPAHAGRWSREIGWTKVV